MQPLELSAVDLVAAVRQGNLSAVACAEAFFDRIAAVDGQINAFLAVNREAAIAQAAEIDARRKAGKPLGPLAGLPVAVKDALCTVDLPTTCASKMLATVPTSPTVSVMAGMPASASARRPGSTSGCGCRRVNASRIASASLGLSRMGSSDTRAARATSVKGRQSLAAASAKPLRSVRANHSGCASGRPIDAKAGWSPERSRSVSLTSRSTPRTR